MEVVHGCNGIAEATEICLYRTDLECFGQVGAVDEDKENGKGADEACSGGQKKPIVSRETVLVS